MATSKIKSPQDLLALKKKAQSEIALRTGEKNFQVTVHMGTCGIAAGARDVLMALADELTSAGKHDVMLKQSGCAGLCSQEPMATVVDGEGREFRYGKLDRYKARRIAREHVAGGTPVVDALIK